MNLNYMGILSETLSTFIPVKEQYYIGCYINDVTKIVGGPDSNPHYTNERIICNRLCHQVVDTMMEWGIGLLQAEDLRPLVSTFFKEPKEHVLQIEDQGMDKYINILSTSGQRKHIMKIVLTAKDWVA